MKPTSPYKAAVHALDFDTLVPAPKLSLVDAKNNHFRNMTTQLYWERQLWSGNKSVKIRYVSGSFVAGTSASSPGRRSSSHVLNGFKKDNYFHVAELEKIKAGGCVTFTANSAKAVANKKNACLQTFV